MITKMNVAKFGGTSVGSADRMKEVANILFKKEGRTIVVLSAMSGVTNSLEGMIASKKRQDKTSYKKAIELLKEKHHATAFQLLKDSSNCQKQISIILSCFNNSEKVSEKEIMALGEQLSTQIFYAYLKEQGKQVCLFDSLSFMILDVNGEPDEAGISELLNAQLIEHSEDFIIVQGFICRDAVGNVSNLQRGGSDYSAALIAAAVNSTCFEIWTDIDGFHNNDPRHVESTKSIASLTFAEAAELAYFGAKILHPATVWPARRKGIPVNLKNTMRPELPGTIICQQGESTGFKAVAAKDGITAVSIRSARMLMAYGFLSKVFGVFEKFETPIDMITTSEVAVSVSIDNTENLPSIVGELSQWGELTIDHEQTIVSVVGHNIGKEKGLAAPVFEALKGIPLRMISFGGSDHNISLLMPSEFKVKALRALNDHLFNL